MSQHLVQIILAGSQSHVNQLPSGFEKPTPPSEQQMVVVNILHVAGTGTAHCQTPQTIMYASKGIIEESNEEFIFHEAYSTV